MQTEVWSTQGLVNTEERDLIIHETPSAMPRCS